jgi:hypothetical protein
VKASSRWFVALFAVAVTVGARSALATADGPDFYAVDHVATGSVLNVRAAPWAASAKIGEIPANGRGLHNLGCQGGPSFATWERMSPRRASAGKSQALVQDPLSGAGRLGSRPVPDRGFYPAFSQVMPLDRCFPEQARQFETVRVRFYDAGVS